MVALFYDSVPAPALNSKKLFCGNFNLAAILIVFFSLLVISSSYAGEGSVSGKVILSGRVNNSSSVTFELRHPGKTTNINTYQVTTDSEGNYILPSIPEGTYDLTAKTISFLKVKKTDIPVSSGGTVMGIDFTLYGGDCDGNDVVNAFDHSILNKAFGTHPGDLKWDARADIDGNGVVNAFDHSAQNVNFGKDSIEPTFSLTSHFNNELIEDSPLAVFSGTITDDTATVTVNGVSAVISKGTFRAEGISLSNGPNTITIKATDKWGNSSWETIKVSFKTPYDLNGMKYYLVYYGSWDSGIVDKLNRYDLVILNINRGPALGEQAGIIDNIQAGLDGVNGTGDDVVVLAYISLGEDERTYGFKEPIAGDGRGPCFYDLKTNQIIYENRGIASYYMDEWNVKGPHSGEPVEHDGIPDRHGTWGACYVNAGDPAWQEHLIGVGRMTMPYSCDVIINKVGYDGFFLDTPEVAGPYEGFGWTAKGMYDLVKLIDQTYPDKILLLNRGVFFFVPHYHYQYQWCPRKYVDIVLYESYYLDSDYGEGDFHYSPYYGENRYFIGPKFNAELGRSDSFCQIVNIDYAADPEHFPQLQPEVYADVIGKAIVEQGRMEFITNKLVTSLNTTVIDNPPSPDDDAPIWLNSTNGFLSIDPTKPFYNSPGADDTNSKPSRVGIQKAIPGNGKVTLRWDAAVDQSRPVKYNVYYATSPIANFDTANCISNAMTSVGGDYTTRGYLSNDDACPYEYTVTGLTNEQSYYFAVRAEDSSSGVISPSSGRIGPDGGIEDANVNQLAAAPRSSAFAITIDGSFYDWANVPYYADSSSDADGGEVEWTGCKITDDEEYLYLYFDCADTIILNDGYVIYLDVDCKSYTGYFSQKGADYMLRGGLLYKYKGTGQDWAWDPPKDTYYSYDGNKLEIRLTKTDIGATAIGGGVNIFFYGDNASGAIDYMPNEGTGGYSYMYLDSPVDTAAPEFDIDSLVASDENIDGTVRLEWAEATDANGPVTYKIYDKNDDLAGTTTKALIYLTGLTNGQEESFKVRAEDSQGNYIDSTRRMVTPTLNTTAPQWVNNVGVRDVKAKDASVKIYWDKASDLSHPPANFNIYYSTSPILFNGSETKLSKVSQAESDDVNYAWMYSIAGLTNGTTYYFAVRTEDRIGNEDNNTAQITVTPQAPSFITTETMDGVFSDWSNDPTVVYCGRDVSGDGAAGSDSADITDIWLGDNEDYLFVRIKLTADVSVDYKYMMFIDTDRNSNTGFKTDWDTVGAEYLSMNGQLMKYTGRDGFADWAWDVLGDNIYFTKGILEKNNIEMTLPRATLELTGEDKLVSIWFYISDEITETLDECYPGYGRGGYVYQFSQTGGILRADGRFEDWGTDTSVLWMGSDGEGDGLKSDSSAGEINESADIKNIWMADSVNYLYLRWEMYGDVNFEGYTYYVYLDTDSDSSTGYRASWGAVGAEYMISNGILNRYTGTLPDGSEWKWEAVGSIAVVGGTGQNAAQFEAAIPRSVIGETGIDQRTSVCFATLDNKGTADFNDDVNDFSPAPGSFLTYTYSQISGPIRLDGNFSDWDAEPSVKLLATDPTDDGYDKNGNLVPPEEFGALADIQNAWAVKDANRLFMKLDFLGNIDFNQAEYTIYLDIDRNKSTGYKVSWDTVGADYRFWNGYLYRYTGDETSWETMWERINGAYYAIGTSDVTQVELAIEKNAINWITEDSIKIFIVVSDKKEEGWEDNINDFMPEQGKGIVYPPIPLSDLTVASVTCSPASPLVNEPAAITVNISNTGPGNAGSFDVTIWIDGVAQAPQTVAGLSSGASAQITFNWTPSEVKLLWIGAKTDSTSQVDEEDETNNENGVNVNVVAPPCDLTVTSVSISPRETPWVGYQSTVTAVIKNLHSTNSADAFDVDLWIGGAKFATQRVSGLAPGQSTSLTFDWTPTSSGVFWVAANADAKSEINETDETNNTDNGINVTVVIDPPDLTVTALTVSPASPEIGIQATITATVANIGDLAPDTGFNVFLWVDSVKVGSTAVGILEPGASVDVTFDWIPARTGNIWVGVSADGDNQIINEKDETNNDLGKWVAVQ